MTEVRYCTSADGTRIAYSLSGDGPAVLRCPAAWDAFGADWAELSVYEAVDRGRTVIRYDFRGVGLSQRHPPSFDLDRMTADIEAVVDAAGIERLSVFASTFSVAPAIAYAASHPERVARMVHARVFTRGADVMPAENRDAIIELIRSNWPIASQVIADSGIRESEDPTLGVRAAEMLRKNMDPDDLATMIAALYENDVLDLLADVHCPTLIMHRTDDSFFPFGAAQHAASTIGTSRLVPMPGSGPISIGSDGEANIRTILAFLDEDPETRALPATEAAAPRSDSSFRTILFTDLVGHTAMMSRLGDDRGRDVLREHERITREVLKSNGGTEVKTMGDGFMASFGSVTKSVECAIALQRAFAEHDGEPLAIRVGLNAGEPIEEDGDLFGATVILASRIAAKADGGEILVADTVRGLCSGKGFLFADRGDFVAKGFEEPVRVYEVSWRAG